MTRIAQLPPFQNKGYCGWCNAVLTGRRTRWCSDECVDEWMIRRDPSWAARKVWRRDRGVCALCGTDTERQRQAFQRLAHWGSARYHERRGYIPGSRTTHRANLYGARCLAARKYGVPISRVPGPNWWDCDHIVPVVEGGGGCGLDNLRTLCIPCHKSETAKLAARRASDRKGQPDLDMGATA
jgi:5-methylcytosine-specific restriction endonuclease McrA